MKNNNSKAIAVSIIGSTIFFIFFEPLLKLVGKHAFNISNKFLKSINNSLYISIGQERYDIDFFIAFLLAALFIFFIFLVYFKSILDTKELLDRSNALASKLSKIKYDKPIVDNENIEEKSTKLNIEIKKIYKMSIILGIVFGVLFIINIFTMLAIQITIKDKVFLYRNTKIVVTPYIDKLDLEMIDSKFHQIQSKEDFDNVFTEINNLLEKENKKIIFRKTNLIELK